MVQSILNALRQFLGTATGWYHSMTTGTQQMQWDYGMMFEYFFAGILLCITVSYVFRLILRIFD